MTDRLTRLYVLVIAVLVFVVLWAVVVAANPWASTKPDPRLVALEQRAQRLRADARLVRQIVALRARQSVAATTQSSATGAPAPVVRVINLPPLTITKTS